MLSYIELSTQNLLHNFSQIKKRLPAHMTMMACLKGNAYGHGLSEIAQMLEKEDCWYAIDDIEELRILRKQTAKDILVMGYIAKSELAEAILLRCHMICQNTEQLVAINDCAQQFGIVQSVHIKVDTGIGRQGILLHELESLLQTAKTLPYIKIHAIYSHLANSDDLSKNDYTSNQYQLLKEAKDIAQSLGFNNIKTHISNTAGTLLHEDYSQDYVRVGAGLYGIWSSEDTKSHTDNVDLKPVLRWVSHIAQIKDIPAGFAIGYGSTFTATQAMKIAIIPQGYADGLDRGLSNQGKVLIHGQECPILGRVFMNMITVDISHLSDVRVEDEVVLLGKQGDQEITADNIAKSLGTINYEVVTRISSLLPRTVING